MIYQDMLDMGALEAYAAALNARAGRAKGRLTASDLRSRILASGGRCEWCGASLVGAEFELDHILSLTRGGANRATNLVVACPDCNRRKSQKHPARFASEICRQAGGTTPFVRRVLAFYGLDPARQLSLFLAEAGDSPAPRDAETELTAAPPYRWVD